MTGKHPTQEMVARRAGVSQSAVSLVFVGGPVSPRLRERILRAARELGYHPGMNMDARRLTSRRATNRLIPYGTLGLLWEHEDVADGFHPFARKLVVGALDQCSRKNLALTVRTFALNEEDQWPPLGQIDGLILPSANPVVFDTANRYGRPVVGLYIEEAGFPAPIVTPDNTAVMRLAVSHLTALGHRRIGYLGLPPIRGISRKRHQAFLTALREAGLTCDPRHAITDYFAPSSKGLEWFREIGEAAFRHLWALENRPTAVIAYNDALAQGILRAARTMRVRIPRDLSLMGIDGLDELTRDGPRLTSVSVRLEAMAARAVDLLQVSIAGKRRATGIHRVEPELLIGETTTRSTERR